MIPVLFIAGLGRSGTTLLEQLIGSSDGVHPLGEVVHLWVRGVRDNEPCGCGERFHDCPFWTAVGERAFGGWHRVDVDAVETLRSQVDRLRSIPRTARSRSTGELRRYTDFYYRLYAAAADISGAAVIVDSSKHPSLAFCLRTHSDVALKVVHAVRDPRAVAYAWTKRVPRLTTDSEVRMMPTYPPWRAAALWSAENVATDALRRLDVPVHRVRYEDFVADVPATLSAIAAFAGPGVNAPTAAADGSYVMPVTHSVSGNPMRFHGGSVTVRRDDAWHTSFPAVHRRTVAALTWPVAQRFGYDVVGRG